VPRGPGLQVLMVHCNTVTATGIGLSVTPSKPHKVVYALLKDASGEDISAQVRVDDILVGIDGKTLDEVPFLLAVSIDFCASRDHCTLMRRSQALTCLSEQFDTIESAIVGPENTLVRLVFEAMGTRHKYSVTCIRHTSIPTPKFYALREDVKSPDIVVDRSVRDASCRFFCVQYRCFSLCRCVQNTYQSFQCFLILIGGRSAGRDAEIIDRRQR